MRGLDATQFAPFGFIPSEIRRWFDVSDKIFCHDSKSIDELPLILQPDSLDEVEHPGVVSRQRRDTEAYDYYAEVDEDEPLYTLYR